MPAYMSNNTQVGTQQPISSTTLYKTQVMVLGGAAGAHGLVQEMAVGTVGTPADAYLEYDVSRWDGTTAGASTQTGTRPLDPDNRQGGTNVGLNYTTEPTNYSASLFYLGLIQRASYRWVAAPGSEIVVPGVLNRGVGLRARGTATTTVSAMMVLIE